MLKALELIGFKSFADKTRFEFPPGITVVVGPNGSGKSNVVDAIKWVLGEQSAKSLRGKEMADVIFKGSGSGARREMNTAEATIVFDNEQGTLAVDTPEVRVTRRVYRSGEGEYLINGQPCRLRDIKELFRGTGVGADAYSLIEQGKVDTLLQASPRDRRAIFEEAAGISRFKAKKVEAQRRLERVDQNLLRLSDIVEEVENQLRSVRAQAAKAKRFQEYQQRLQELRTHVARVDWRRLSERLARLEGETDELRQQRDALAAEVRRQEAAADACARRFDEAAGARHECESRLAGSRESIASREAIVEHLRRECRKIDEETAAQRERLAELRHRTREVGDYLGEAERALEEAEVEHAKVERRVAHSDRVLAEIAAEVESLHASGESLRCEHLEKMRAAAGLESRVTSLKAQAAAAAEAAERCMARLAELATLVDAAHREEADARQAEAACRAAVERIFQKWERAQEDVLRRRRQRDLRQKQLAEMAGRLSGMTQRAEVLDQLERRLEGVGSGARQMLRRAEEDTQGPFSDVRGLVAGLIEVDLRHAAVIEAALGERSQFVVYDGSRLPAYLAATPAEWASRTGLIPCNPPADLAVLRLELDAVAGVIARADRLVRTSPPYELLVERLLGDTWVVEQLAVAMELHGRYAGRLRFVTRAGEVLEKDGSLLVGAARDVTGLISRRSELRVLRQQAARLGDEVAAAEAEIAALEAEVDRQEQFVEQARAALEQARGELVGCQTAIRAAEERSASVERERAAAVAELEQRRAQQGDAERQVEAVSSALARAEAEVQELDARLRCNAQRLSERETRRRAEEREVNFARIELATSQQRLETYRARVQQFRESRDERRRHLVEQQRQLRENGARLRLLEGEILAATSELAESYLAKDRLAAESAEWLRRQDECRSERGALAVRSQQLRKELQQIEERLHKRELAAGELRHERGALAERLREDYGIDLAAVQEVAEVEQLARQEVEEEITALRRKISNIGAVNLEALEELDGLESRFASLSTQFKDLVAAKQSLEKIIHRINADSRRLFAEALEAVRTNFQTLFRKVFGGGRADILLEEEMDMLDAGVEIIATPPGKNSLNISLLSGGERALTAVTLLLAIFQFRPSPFCVLDEVDGPLDEANIDRVIGVLREFLGWTKFVIVSHSKKTMAAATTLYGVTMQESGVSKRVSVRFDDVSDDGHISDEALRRQEMAEQTERGAA